MEANEIILLIQGNVAHKPAALGNHRKHSRLRSLDNTVLDEVR